MEGSSPHGVKLRCFSAGAWRASWAWEVGMDVVVRSWTEKVVFHYCVVVRHYHPKEITILANVNPSEDIIFHRFR